MASLNAAREFNIQDLGAVAPGYLADILLVRELGKGVPEAVFIGGSLVAENGSYLGEEPLTERTGFSDTVNISQLKSQQDFYLRVAPGHTGYIETSVLAPDPVLPLFSKLEWMKLPVTNGAVDISEYPDLCFMMVANRYERDGKTIAVLKGRELRRGAYATTISHDSHNMTILYRDPAAAYEAACALKESGGGICVVDGSSRTLLELPVAGLMSLLPIRQLTERIAVIEQAVYSVCQEGTDILLASILALACLPCPIVTDVGIFDGLSQQKIENFRT